MQNQQSLRFEYNNNKPANFIFDFAKTMILFFMIFAIIFTFFIREVKVSGSSMNDTLFHQDRVVLTNFNYIPKTGDIIAASTDKLSEKYIIKRVIATEGQTLEIDYDKGAVYVDGILLDEDYTSSITRKATNEYKFPYTIPENSIFVMGDNRAVSLDSRNAKLGLLSEDDILGKAQFIFYPFERITYLY